MTTEASEVVERQRRLAYEQMSDDQLIMAALDKVLECLTSRFQTLQHELQERAYADRRDKRAR